MTDFQSREKIVTEYENDILPTIINRSQQIKSISQEVTEKGKEISEKMEDISDIAKNKLEVLKDNREIILESEDKVWTSFIVGYNRDRSLGASLDQVNTDLIQTVPPLSFIATSTSTMVDSSGNVRDGLLTIVANLNNAPIQNISERYCKDYFLKNKNIVRRGLSNFYPNYLPEFDDVIRDWESKSFRDMKLLISLRSVIFGKLIGLGCNKREYKKTIWFNNGFFKNGTKYFYKVIYFILGNNDPSKYPITLIQQINDIANNLSIIHKVLLQISENQNA